MHVCSTSGGDCDGDDAGELCKTYGLSALDHINAMPSEFTNLRWSSITGVGQRACMQVCKSWALQSVAVTRDFTSSGGFADDSDENHKIFTNSQNGFRATGTFQRYNSQGSIIPGRYLDNGVLHGNVFDEIKYCASQYDTMVDQLKGVVNTCFEYAFVEQNKTTPDRNPEYGKTTYSVAPLSGFGLLMKDSEYDADNDKKVGISEQGGLADRFFCYNMVRPKNDKGVVDQSIKPSGLLVKVNWHEDMPDGIDSWSSAYQDTSKARSVIVWQWVMMILFIEFFLQTVAGTGIIGPLLKFIFHKLVGKKDDSEKKEEKPAVKIDDARGGGGFSFMGVLLTIFIIATIVLSIIVAV